MQLYQKYRPKDWPEVVGQDAAVKSLLAFRDRNGGTFGGSMFFLQGKSGQGKTSLAKLVAADCTGDCELSTFEVGGPKVTADWLNMIEERTAGRPLGGKGWAMIVNEVQSFKRDQVDRLNDVLEHIPAYCVWVFSTTNTGSDRLFEIDEAPAFLSRAKKIKLAERDLCGPFAAKLVQVARAEGLLNGKPDSYYLPIAERQAKVEGNNFRALYNWAEMGGFTAREEREGGDA